MKVFSFLVALLALVTVCFGQELTPTPDPISGTIAVQQVPGQTLGEMLRLCVEIQADIDAADTAAGVAQQHLVTCQGRYNYAVTNSMEAAADLMESGYTDPLAVIRMNYWAGQVAWSGLMLSNAQSSFDAALAELTRFQVEFATKGC